MKDDVACPFCGSTTSKSLVETWKEYRILDCKPCGMAFASPFKNPGPEFYRQYVDMYKSEAATTTDPMSLEYDACLDLIRRHDLQGKRLLDVGCGKGGFIHRARGLGLSVSGLDFNAAMLEKIREQLGIRSLYCMSLPEFAASHPEECFDVITILEVL